MEQRPQKGARSLDIVGQKWWWLIGSGLNVLIWSPSGKKSRTTMHEITKRPHSVIERGQWKRTCDGMLKPEQVREYILLNQSTLA